MKKNESTSGVSFLGLLTLLFIALKLTDKIDWSWVWVLSPAWIPTVIVLILILVIALIKVVKDNT